MLKHRIIFLLLALGFAYFMGISIVNGMVSSQSLSSTLAQEQWVFETVAYAQGEWGTVHDHSLAFDKMGNIHLSYYDSFDSLYGVLIYANWDGTTWISETVDNSGGAYPSLMVDSSNNPHLSYFIIGPTGDIKYARRDASSWISETVTSVGRPTDIPLALDKNDFPHINYRNNDHLEYAYWTGSMWITDTAATGNGGAPFLRSPSLALDGNDNPHSSFHDWTGFDSSNSSLQYVQWSGTSWLTETIADSQYETNLVLDTSDNPHIVFVDTVDNGELFKHAYWSGSIWEVEVIDPEDNNLVYNLSLAIDANDMLHVSYIDDRGLMYAHQTEGGWITEPLMKTNVSETTIVLDNEGQPYIAFYDSLSKELILAHKEPVEEIEIDVFLPFVIK